MLPLGRLVSASALALAALAVTPAAPAGAAAVSCLGSAATIVATADGQALTGTEGPDVISAAGFVEVTIDALGGDDRVCNVPARPPLYGRVQSVDGGAGDDVIEAGTSVVAHGGSGDDTLLGRGYAADLHGDDGDDVLTLEHTDALARGQQAHGGAGDDVLSTAGVSGALLEGGDGDDSLTATVAGTPARLDPGAGDDVVHGTRGTRLDYSGTTPVTFRVADGVVDGQGHDVFTGITEFSGGDGADTFNGGDGPDTYLDSDYLTDTPGRDTVLGNGGDDTLTSTRGTVRGGAGDDTISVVGGRAWGGPGDDTMVAELGGEAWGGPGEDDIDGQLDLDWISSDQLDEDVAPVFALHGGPGDDRVRAARPFQVDPDGRVTTCGLAAQCRNDLDGGRGTDTLALTRLVWPATVDLAKGKLTYRVGRGHVASFERVQGTSRDDRLLGSGRADELRGMRGDDVLIGRGGRDTAVGGPGRDHCSAERRRSC
jgi:Ca2+-binding RTX toxin-like protein